MLRRDHVAPRGKRADRRNHIGSGMSAVEGGHDLVERAFPVEESQQLGVELAVQQGVEGLGDQQHLPFADLVELQMRGERRTLHASLVL